MAKFSTPGAIHHKNKKEYITLDVRIFITNDSQMLLKFQDYNMFWTQYKHFCFLLACENSIDFSRVLNPPIQKTGGQVSSQDLDSILMIHNSD